MKPDSTLRACMWKRSFLRNLSSASAVLGLLFVIQDAAAQSRYEDLPSFRAADVLLEELLSGPNHQVLEEVINDGYLNTYTITSAFGETTAVSTALVAVRVHELNAIAAMDEVEKSESFQEGAEKAATGAYEGTKSLIIHPKETLSGAVTGVGRLFHRAADATAHHDKSNAEDSRYKAMIGFSKAKREIAAQFGVDVYSTNQILQDRLDDLAWTQFAGDIAIKAPLAHDGGGVGAAISTTQAVTALNNVVATTPPEDLRTQNRDKLRAMGIHEDITDLFMQNGTFTPRQQTFLVSALHEMSHTANRGAFVKFAVPTDTEDLAFFRQRMAMLWLAYDKEVERVTEFVGLGRFVAGRTQSGAIVFLVPVDCLVWTKSAAAVFADVGKHVAALDGVSQKQLWVNKLTTRSRKELIPLGWETHENVEKELLQKSM